MASATIGSDIDVARDRYFVGRQAELQRLDALFDEAGPTLAYVHGPGGVGKSELLQLFARRREELGNAVSTIDARSIVANEQGFLDAIETAQRGLDRTLDLLVIDSLDHAWHLERWLREVYLPALPAMSRVVFGGRDPLDGAWLASPAWRSRLAAIELENLSREETSAYLDRVDVAARHHGTIYECGFGHPLATALLAEIGLRCEGDFPHLGRLPDVVQTVLSHLLREVLEDAQRLALWCAAVVPALSEDLLGRMIPDEFEPQLFEWLRGLSFVCTTERGLMLHDLARASLTADVQWRAPEVRRVMVERAINEYLHRMQASSGETNENGRAIVATMQLFGHHLNLGATDSYYASTLESEDWPQIEAMVTRHEGEEAGAVARFWRDRGAEIMVVRDRSGEPAGCSITLWLDQIDRNDAAQDPGVLPLFSHLEEAGLLGAGRIYLVRFWMGRESYQSFDTPVASVLITRILTQPFVDGMALGFTAHGDPHSLMAVSSSLDHYDDCSFELGDRTYHVMGHDFRDDPPSRWFQRVLTNTIRQAPTRSLDRVSFTEATRNALRFIRQPEKLATNPLLRSHLFEGQELDASPPVAAERLQAVMRSGIESIAHDARNSAAHRLLAATYLGRPIKQRAVCAELGMSYSTYRRRHAEALAHLTEVLWQRDGSNIDRLADKATGPAPIGQPPIR
jgi:hypothetical protein